MISYILKYASLVAFAVMVATGFIVGLSTFDGIECILASVMFLSLHLAANQMIKYDQFEERYNALTQEINKLNKNK